MKRPIDRVLDALSPYHLRAAGNDRWRACCPAHRGTNPSTLSVGIGESDTVLFRCWHGCEAHEVARAIGIELHELFPPPPNQHSTPKPRRVGLLTTRQALDVIRAECALVWTAARNLAAGHALTPSDLLRLDTAAGRIEHLINEVDA